MVLDGQTLVGWVALFVSTLITIVGAFAYMSGEMRKVANTARTDSQRVRDELLGSVSRIEQEFYSLSAEVAKRGDLKAIEDRLVHDYDRLETKLDQLANSITRHLYRHPSGETEHERN